MLFVASMSTAAVASASLLRPPAILPAALASRHSPLRCTYSSAAWPEEWGSSPGDATQEPTTVDPGAAGGPPSRWQRIGECDVLLPDYGGECNAIVHFVGGALVGGAPVQTYGAFLETLADHGLCVVANPSSGLTGLDHWGAARDVYTQWVDAQTELREQLVARGFLRPQRLPIVGLGHSLGCKLLLLLGSQPGCVGALGHRANVLLSFNNFDAARSVPLLEPAAQLQRALRLGYTPPAWPLATHPPRTPGQWIRRPGSLFLLRSSFGAGGSPELAPPEERLPPSPPQALQAGSFGPEQASQLLATLGGSVGGGLGGGLEDLARSDLGAAAPGWWIEPPTLV